MQADDNSQTHTHTWLQERPCWVRFCVRALSLLFWYTASKCSSLRHYTAYSQLHKASKQNRHQILCYWLPNTGMPNSSGPYFLNGLLYVLMSYTFVYCVRLNVTLNIIVCNLLFYFLPDGSVLQHYWKHCMFCLVHRVQSYVSACSSWVLHLNEPNCITYCTRNCMHKWKNLKLSLHQDMLWSGYGM